MEYIEYIWVLVCWLNKTRLLKIEAVICVFHFKKKKFYLFFTFNSLNKSSVVELIIKIIIVAPQYTHCVVSILLLTK